jgi:hypothetical protein
VRRTVQQTEEHFQYPENSGPCTVGRALEYETPELTPPFRVMLLMASTEAWYSAPAEGRSEVLETLDKVLRRLTQRGAHLIGSYDDDLFATGQPSTLPYSIYALYDTDDLASIVELVHEIRLTLGHALRVEARIGRRLFLLEN